MFAFPMWLLPAGRSRSAHAVEQAGNLLEHRLKPLEGPDVRLLAVEISRPSTSATSALVSSSKWRKAMISRSSGSIH